MADFDIEPPAFLYAFTQSYQTITYYRLDPPGTSATNLLKKIKTNLTDNLPPMFGLTVYDSIKQANGAGKGNPPFLHGNLLLVAVFSGLPKLREE